MPTSQNGYSANDRSQVTTWTIGSKTKVALRKGSTGALLVHLGNWFDANIRNIDAGALDDWGYAERTIRGESTTLSNHASGTALDVDATKWPLGVEPSAYLTAAEIAKVRAQLKVYEGCIRWGGDYTGRKDPMHFEINKPQAVCDRVLTKLTAAPAITSSTEDDELDATQAAQLRNTEHMLMLLLQQAGTSINLASGKEQVPWPGWPQLGGHTIVDAVAELRADVQAIKKKLAP